MKGYKSDSYGDKIADQYDEMYPNIDRNMIKRLSEFALNGSAFELGIGTGRVAFPLINNGIKVDGIDASKEMVKKLMSKPDSSKTSVQIGNFSNFETKKKYDLVYVVFNTFFVLTSQETQINCFKCAYKSLKPKGSFVIEAFVPDVCRFDRGQTLRTSSVLIDNVELECTTHDRANQLLSSQIIKISESGIKLQPIKIRYVWPSEMDLMAQIAGFNLSERWSNWQKAEFTNLSGFHISIYNKK